MVTSWSGKERYKEKKFGDGRKHGALRKNPMCVEDKETGVGPKTEARSGASM